MLCFASEHTWEGPAPLRQSPRRVREKSENSAKGRQPTRVQNPSVERVVRDFARSAKPPNLAWHARGQGFKSLQLHVVRRCRSSLTELVLRLRHAAKTPRLEVCVRGSNDQTILSRKLVGCEASPSARKAEADRAADSRCLSGSSTRSCRLMVREGLAPGGTVDGTVE